METQTSIFKVHVYDQEGKISRVYIFNGHTNEHDEEDIRFTDYFTNEVLELYKTQDTKFIVSPHYIYPDDSIETIKRKLLFSLGTSDYDSLYLFSWKQAPKPFHLFDYGNDQDIVLRNTDLPNTEELNDEKDVHIIVPLGYTNANNNSVVKNPYLATDFSTIGVINDNDKSRLLKYGSIKDQDIFVVLATDILSTISSTQEQNAMRQIYFPYLTYKSDETSDIMKTPLEPIPTFLDTWNNIYNNYKPKLSYVEEGITSFSFLYNVTDDKRKWPLDGLFKLLHANETRPLLMYNPGKFRENILRLFSSKLSTNGKLIPLLDKKTIQKILMTFGNPSETLHSYGVITSKEHKNVDGVQLFVSMNKLGNLKVQCISNTKLQWTDCTNHILPYVNNLIADINNCLFHIGYKILPILNLYDVKVLDIRTSSSIVVHDSIQILKTLPCITSVVDVYNDNVSNKHDILLRYKRSETYVEQEAKKNLVQFIYNHYDDEVSENVAKQRLIQNYSLTEDAADKFIDSFENVAIDDIYAGFPIIMSLSDNKLTVTCTSLTSFQYLPLMKMLIDCILICTQSSKQKAPIIPISSIASICNTVVYDDETVDDITSEIPELEVYHATEELEEPRNDDDVFDDINEENFVFDDQEIPAPIAPEPKTEVPAIPDLKAHSSQKKSLPPSIPVLADDEEDNKLEGMSLNKYFLKGLQQKDPVLFVYKKDGYESYSRMCPASDYRQPVVLTKEEYDNVKTNHKDAYSYALEYGSSPDNIHYYICPRYWCLKTQTPLTEEEAKSGVCGDIIPQDAKHVPNNAFVYEFNSNKKQHKNMDGTYALNHPGYLKEQNPLGLNMPCCFKTIQKQFQANDEKEYQVMKAMKLGKQQEEYNDVKYIISHSTFPIPAERWGYLPNSVQTFLHTDNNLAKNKKRPSYLLQNHPCLLRYGVEFSEIHSFLACIAEIYNKIHHPEVYRKNPTIREMQKLLSEAITLDEFLSYQNGNLIQVFASNDANTVSEKEKDTYQDSKFLQNTKDENKIAMVIDSYKNFIKYITDSNTLIDHTYLWDAVTRPNTKLIKNGMNLVILEIMDNDDTENISLICPTNSSYVYDPKKDTFILLKKGVFYEPIYRYTETKNEIQIVKAFRESYHTGIIQKVLKLVREIATNYCSPKDSRPRIYTFKYNLNASIVKQKLLASNYDIKHQVINYNYQCIGYFVYVGDTKTSVVVPCAPSSIQPDISWKFMDSNDLWNDFSQTVKTLHHINKYTKLPCLPKVAISEDSVIIGILTETNQFLRTLPINETDIDYEIDVVRHTDYIGADKELTTTSGEDNERGDDIKRIKLENQFYTAFRMLVRSSIHKQENKEIKLQIENILHDSESVYKDKMKALIQILNTVLGTNQVEFQTMKDQDVLTFGDITGCSLAYNQNPFCLIKTDNNKNYSVLLIPKTNLINRLDNEVLYMTRMADDLIRNYRIRRFMFNPKMYFSDMNIHYSVYNNELLILISILLDSYFDDISVFDTNKYLHNLTFENAQPNDSTVAYSNVVGLDEQTFLVKQKQDHEDQDVPRDLPLLKANDQDTNNVRPDVGHIAVDSGLIPNEEVAMLQEADDSQVEAPLVLDETKEDDVMFQESSPVIGVLNEVQGNRSTGKWVFKRGASEVTFPESSNFAAIQYVLHKLNKPSSIDFIKDTIFNSKFINDDVYVQKTIKIFKIQNKTKLMADVISKRKTFYEVIQSDDYYLSDLDMWILAHELKLPILLFASTPLKNMIPNYYLFLSSTQEQIHGALYFIRSNTKRDANVAPEYTVITPTYSYRELVKGSQMISESVESKQLPTIETYYDSVTVDKFVVIRIK